MDGESIKYRHLLTKEGLTMSSVALLLPDAVFSKPRERTPDEQSTLESWEVNSNLAESIGMTALVEEDRRRLLDPIRVRDLAAHDVVPLTESEVAMWRAWLLRSYRTDIDRNSAQWNIFPWSVYTFDAIPINVRNFILNVRQKELFDMLELRTPEDSSAEDPALFGWVGNSCYLLARWGESDDTLLTTDQIKAGVDARRDAERCGDARENVVGWGIGLSVVAAVILIVACGVMACDCYGEERHLLLPTIVGGIGLLTVLGFGTYLWARSLKIRQRTIEERVPYAF